MQNVSNNLFDYGTFFKENWKKISIIVLCGFINAFASVVLLYASSTIPNGLDSISFTLSYIFPNTIQYMMLIYLGLNVPLIIFFWKKIKTEFIILTLIYLIFNGLFGIFFGQGFIKDFFINDVFMIIKNGNKWNYKYESTNIVHSGWAILIYMLIAVSINSPTNAWLWKTGASTGGTDIIAYYISIKKKKNVGKFLITIGYLLAFISIIILFLLKKYQTNSLHTINGFQSIGGMQTISTFLFIFIDGLIVNTLYPKYKKVKVKIDVGNDYSLITKWLNDSEYYHPYKIIKIISGHTKKESYSIETIMLYLECDEFIKKAKETDSKAWISVVPISKTFGNFNYSYIE